MHELAILFSILGVFLLGAISPGPSFVVVSRIAISGSRADGVMAAIGMGIGGFLFACIAVAGLTAILLQVEWLNLALRLAGGAYLVWLGINIWRAAPEPIEVAETATGRPSTLWKSLLRGLFVQLSNPKTAIFYASMSPRSCPRRHHPGCCLLCRRCSSSTNSFGTPSWHWVSHRADRRLPICDPKSGSTAPREWWLERWASS